MSKDAWLLAGAAANSKIVRRVFLYEEITLPTYICTTLEGRLSAAQRQEIAGEITRLHCEATGAPGYFAQVIYETVKPGNYFVGGKPLQHDQIFVYGRVRHGRATQDKSRMITRMAEAISRIADAPKTGVWVYVGDVPARQMIEFGHVLPEPGDEEAWTAGLPQADRAWMQSIGKN